MKKSILVLSALLTLVVSGVCLQSCSSEYDEYTTEEYGYYTEEEIAAIKALGEKYGVNIEMDVNYYGVKPTFSEIEDEIRSTSLLIGEYEMIPKKDLRGLVSYTCKKKGEEFNNNKTRSIEKGSWSGSGYLGQYCVNVYITWDQTGFVPKDEVSGSAELAGYFNSSSDISCDFSGSRYIVFSGTVTATGYYGGTYTMTISDGELNRANNYGTFTLHWGCAL